MNTGNRSTGNLTLTLGGANADAFTLSAGTLNSMSTGGEAPFTVAPKSGLAEGRYMATVTVGNDNVAPTTFAVTFRVGTTGNENVSPPARLKAWTKGNGTLHVSGLTVGELWSVYNMQGQLVYRNTANNDEADVILSDRGVYTVISGNQSVKVIYY